MEITKKNYTLISVNPYVLTTVKRELDNGKILFVSDLESLGNYLCSSYMGMVQILENPERDEEGKIVTEYMRSIRRAENSIRTGIF